MRALTKERLTSPEYRKDMHRSRTYGLSPAEYRAKMAEQKRRCEICRTPFTADVRPNVDHCHETGGVRGILCTSCNVKLALLENTPALVMDMVKYLKRHGSWGLCLSRMAADPPAPDK
jgi:5-methylcytosine-specific restriction endonuclease McrA